MFEMNDSKINNYADHMQVDVPSQHTEDTLYSLLVWYCEIPYYCSSCVIYIAAYVDSGNTYLKVRLFNNCNNINVEYRMTYYLCSNKMQDLINTRKFAFQNVSSCSD